MERLWAILPGLVLGFIFAGLSFPRTPEKWHWRAFTAMAVAVGTVIIALGGAGLVIGCLVPLAVPFVYFVPLQYRQFGLLEALLFLLILGSLGAAAARVGALP